MKTLFECTPWFDAKSQRPVRVGEYQYRFEHKVTPSWARWDGKQWVMSNTTKPFPFPIFKGDQWRGLTKEWK